MAEEASSSVETTTETETQTTATEQQTQETPRSFSQADVDRIVKERLARVKADPPADYEELKTKASKLDDLEAANKTELEKAQERMAKAERAAADAAERAQEHLLRAAVVAEAARKNVIDPEAAMALIDRATLEFDKEGAPTNIADAMDLLLKAKPYLVGGGKGSADQGARSTSGVGQLSSESLKTMTPEQIVKARQEGRFDAVLKGER